MMNILAADQHFSRYYIYQEIQVKRSRPGEYYIWDIKTESSKNNIIKNLDDYIKVDDFYRSLKERNSRSEDERAKLNAQCYKLSGLALKIDWSNYK